jgi:hypothetical protein
MTAVKPLFPNQSRPLESRPATAPASPKTLTQTRKHINALLAQDYHTLCKQLDEAIKTAQQLMAAKADLELLAKISNVQLDPPHE